MNPCIELYDQFTKDLKKICTREGILYKYRYVVNDKNVIQYIDAENDILTIMRNQKIQEQQQHLDQMNMTIGSKVQRMAHCLFGAGTYVTGTMKRMASGYYYVQLDEMQMFANKGWRKKDYSIFYYSLVK